MIRTMLVVVLFNGIFCRTFAQTVLRYDVHFTTDKYDLSKETKRILDSVSGSVKDYKSYSIEVVGHTDGDGSDSYNQKLSQKRSAVVKKYLSAKGCTNMNDKFKGETTPIASNETAEGKGKNRRTEIIVRHSENKPALVAKQTKGSIDELYKLLRKAPQEFCIDPTKDTVLKSEAGMYLFIRAYAFTLTLPSTNPCVKITIEEAFTKSDMLMANLSTASDNKMLVTGGTFYMSAEYNGKKLEQAPGSVLTVMPTAEYDPDMRMFTGVKEAHSNSMNWLLANAGLPSQLNAADLLECSTQYVVKKQYVKCMKLSCRVKDFFKRITGQRIVARASYRNKAKTKCASLQALFSKYKVSNLDQLSKAMQQERVAQIESKMAASGKIDASDMNYYIFNVPKLGWINCDKFAKYQPEQLANLNITASPGDAMDVKIVFQNIRSVMPATATEFGYQFANIPKHAKVWVVAIKYADGQAFLALKEVRISDDGPVKDLEFEKCTLPQLKQKLKILDV